MVKVTRAELEAGDLTRKNLAALAAGGQDLARAWLREAPEAGPVSLAEAAGGAAVVLAGGQSQASRRDPAAEAGAWLAETGLPAGDLILFGFGQPWAVELLLKSGRPLAVFEPDPLVALAVLSRHDFSSALARPVAGLRLLTPWHLAEPDVLAFKTGFRPGLLVHPPAQRRAGAALAQLTRRLAGPRLRAPAGPGFRFLVLPPLSGGPEPVAEALARAAADRGFKVLYMDWGADLKAREKQAQGPASAAKDQALARLLAEAGRRAAAAAADFQPELVLALAQAPLTGPALNRLRDQATEAVLAFWLVEDFRLFPYALETAPAYDAFFHIQAGLIEPALRAVGLDQAHYLPLAADPVFFQPRPDIPPAFRAELSFMGAGYPNRVRLLEGLAARYQPSDDRAGLKIFGSGWPSSGRLAERLFEGGRRVSPRECAFIYAGGRVNLNLHSSLRDEAAFDDSGRFVNPRTFEIAAAGGLQIVDPRPLLPPLFIPGREVIVAGSPGDLPGLIDHYLARPEEAAALGRAARARVLKEHTYGHRLEQILAGSGFEDAFGPGEQEARGPGQKAS